MLFSSVFMLTFNLLYYSFSHYLFICESPIKKLKNVMIVYLLTKQKESETCAPHSTDSTRIVVSLISVNLLVSTKSQKKTQVYTMDYLFDCSLIG